MATRTCSVCSTEMTQGYVVGGGEEYYCSDNCLHTKYTHDEWMEMYGDGNTDNYWTTWEDDDDEGEDDAEFEARSLIRPR